MYTCTYENCVSAKKANIGNPVPLWVRVWVQQSRRVVLKKYTPSWQGWIIILNSQNSDFIWVHAISITQSNNSLIDAKVMPWSEKHRGVSWTQGWIGQCTGKSRNWIDTKICKRFNRLLLQFLEIRSLNLLCLFVCLLFFFFKTAVNTIAELCMRYKDGLEFVLIKRLMWSSEPDGRGLLLHM